MGFVCFSVALVLVFSCCVKGQATSKCDSKIDCEDESQCCGEVCKKWRHCNGACDSDKDCDDNNGENCVNGRCKCRGTECNEIIFPVSLSCTSAADCEKDEICNKQSKCVQAHSSSPKEESGRNSLSWRTVVILTISVLVAVVLVALFIHCIFRAKAERARGHRTRNPRRIDSFLGSVRWRSSRASSSTQNRYNYESAATNITIDLNEDTARNPNSEAPPEYDTSTERPLTPPPSYEEALQTVADCNSRTESSINTNFDRDTTHSV